MTVARHLARTTGAAVLLSLGLASVPADARSYRGNGGYHHHHRGNGIGVGGALLGAAIIGGIAVAASNNDRREREYAPAYGGGYAPQPEYAPAYGDDYASNEYQAQSPAYDEPRSDPVADCSRAAERQAQGGGGFARVVGIDRVDGFDGGANVRGTLEIDRGSYAPIRRLGFSCTANDGEVTRLRLN